MVKRKYMKKYKRRVRTRKTRRYRRKGKGFKRANNFRPQNSLMRPGAMPLRLRCKFVYQNQQPLTSNLGVIANYIWRGNGVYDPDQTGTGTQPPGWDDMQAFYARYCCYMSVITFKLATTAVIPVNITLTPYYAASAAGIDYTTAASMPGTKRITCKNLYAGGYTYFKHAANSVKITGIGASDQSCWSIMTNNPGEQWYWVLTVQACDEASSVSMVADVKISYYCWLTQRKITPED